MPPKQGTGSGVIISQDGYIVTNNHVIDFADEVKVNLTDGRKFTAKVVGKDPRTDLAVLKINQTGLPAIQKGNSDNLKIGEWVLAIGNPYDIGITVTAGIVSAKDKKLRNDNPKSIEDFIQTDAVVNPGNSGGALVDATGKLVGINTAIQTRTGSYEGYSFAIPVTIMNKVVDDIIKTGSVQGSTIATLPGARPRLGIEMVNDRYFKQATTEQDINVEEGVFVADVEDGSPAQLAGIVPNDVIVKIEGNSVKNTQDVRDIISKSKVGDVVKVTVFRNNKTKVIPVTLKAI
jgi:S1-C subfamily serine protease